MGACRLTGARKQEMPKESLKTYYIVTMILVNLSCINGERPTYLSRAKFEVHDTLLYSDPMNCVTITEIASTPERLYCLDSPSARVSVFGEDDACLFSFGRNGSGPGEMSAPIAISALSSGSVLISDFSGLHLFDSNGHWISNIVEYVDNPMMELHTLDSCTFIAYKHNVYMSERHTVLDWTLASYDLSGERGAVFLSDTISIDMLDATEILNQSMFSFRCACGAGKLFSFNRNKPAYIIECRDSEGSFIYTIEQDIPVVEKCQDEIDAEAESVESWLNGAGESNVMEYEYEPRPWREPVRDMWVTEDGCQLWVQRGDLDGFIFDIYATEDGTLLETAEILLDTTGLCEVEFFVADSSRIYAILETRDFDQLLVSFVKAP